MRALELALEDNEAFKAVLDEIPLPAWISCPDGKVQFFNRKWLEYTGWSLEDTDAKRRYDSVLHPADRDRMWAGWRESAKSGEPFAMEYRVRRALDGSYRWVQAKAVPLRDAQGKIQIWLGIAMDVDRQKRSNENLRFVLDASSVFASASSPEGIADQFARLAVEQFADWCFVVLGGDGEPFRVTSVQHRDPEKVRLVWEYANKYPLSTDDAFAALVARREAILFSAITDEMLLQAAKDEDHLRMLRALAMHSAIVAPLCDTDRVVGAILLYTAESRRTFDEVDMDVLTMLTQRAAAAISRQQKMSAERRARARLQFISRAAETIYESLDLTATFGELVRLIAQSFGDFAIAARIEKGTMLRVIAASHRDTQKDDAARSLVGVRPFQPDAEKKFIAALRGNEAVARAIDPHVIARSTWPYLSAEIAQLSPAYAVTIPLHLRGTTYGAIVAYSSDPERQYAPEEVDVLVEIGRHASIAMENVEAFERERRMAQTLQDSLLPPSLPRIKGLRLDAVYLPSETGTQVGGDWYDAFALDDGCVVVSTGDVTGRGPDAAVIMGKVRHLIAIAPSYERDPARILDTVESVLARRYPDAIVTAFLGIIDADRRTLRYANAGHPYPLIRRKGEVEELVADGLPIGLRRAMGEVQSCAADIRDACLLVMYTDGLVEATHDVLEGCARLRDVVSTEAVLHTHNPATFIEESCLKQRADDDVAILTVAFEPSVRWAFDAENARAAQDARTQFVRYLRANARDLTELNTAEVIFGELVGNVVRHSPGPIDIDLDWSSERPVLHVIDRGQAFELTNALPKDVLSESGRGLFIVESLSGQLRVERIEGYGNHVIAELPLRRKIE